MYIMLQVTILENVYWKEFGLLAFVWVAFLAIQIAKVLTFLIVYKIYSTAPTMQLI